MKKHNNLEKNILILQFISKHRNERAAISTNEIIKQVKEKDITIDNRAIQSTVESFNNIQDDYKIHVVHSNPKKYYFESQHELGLGESKAIIDLIYSSHFFTIKTKENFINQMKYFFNSKDGEKLNKNIYTHIYRNEDSRAFDDSFSKITQAIYSKKVISFEYKKPSPEPTKINTFKKHIYPIETVSENNNFYLYCYKEEAEEIRCYRIDHIQNVQILDHFFVLPQNVIDDVRKRIMDSTSAMAVERYADITFKFNKYNYANMIDKFGNHINKDVKIHSNYYVVKINNCPISSTFYGWLIGFAGNIKIIEPECEVTAFTSYLKEHFINE